MTHYLLFETLEENNERKIQYRLDTYPLLILSPSNQLDFIRKPIEFYIEQYFEFDHYVKFSLKDLGSERFLLRFMNIDDKINKKFSIREIFDWEERTLDGVLSLEEEKIQRFKWNFEEKNEEKPEKISQFSKNI